MYINAYQVTEDFEKCVAAYAGSKFAVSTDNASNAMFMALKYLGIEGKEITLPSRTYMSVPCAIIHAGGQIKFDKKHPSLIDNKLKGQYRLDPFPVWDSALTFKKNMYIPGEFMCLSFSGPYKFLKLGKGGMILTDDEKAYEWFKKARYNGRNAVGHTSDTFTMVGWNFYMLPEIAAKGLVQMMGMPDNNEDLVIEYQDLSKYKMYTEANR